MSDAFPRTRVLLAWALTVVLCSQCFLALTAPEPSGVAVLAYLPLLLPGGLVADLVRPGTNIGIHGFLDPETYGLATKVSGAFWGTLVFLAWRARRAGTPA